MVTELHGQAAEVARCAEHMTSHLDGASTAQVLSGAAGVVQDPAELGLHLVPNVVLETCPYQLAE